MAFFPGIAPYLAVLLAVSSPAEAAEVRQVVAPTQASDVVAFWREAGPTLWFAKDDAFDRTFRERFLSLHEAARTGQLTHWINTADGALALVILLDQFPRNAFRGAPRMYATDELARHFARKAIAARHDRTVDADLQLFFYLPLAHSESLADQNESVALAKRLGGINYEHAQRHRDIIRQFGRFPHRNPILGRPMLPEEQAFLDNGGFKG